MITPGESEAAVEQAGPIKGQVVHGFDGVDEMVGMLLSDIFDTKVIRDQSKGNEPCVVCPRAGMHLVGV